MGITKRKRQRIDLGLMALEPRWMAFTQQLKLAARNAAIRFS